MSGIRKYKFKSNNQARKALRLLQRRCTCLRLGSCVVLSIPAPMDGNAVTDTAYKYLGFQVDVTTYDHRKLLEVIQ